MYNQRIVLLILLLSICTAGRIFSQITPSTPSVGGCAPFNVSYTGPTGATSHTWNFGDASGLSNSASGTHIYLNPGTYNCTYSGNGNPSSFAVTVHVYAIPTASF